MVRIFCAGGVGGTSSWRRGPWRKALRVAITEPIADCETSERVACTGTVAMMLSRMIESTSAAPNAGITLTTWN